jgi:hypothetical protein
MTVRKGRTTKPPRSSYNLREINLNTLNKLDDAILRLAKTGKVENLGQIKQLKTEAKLVRESLKKRGMLSKRKMGLADKIRLQEQFYTTSKPRMDKSSAVWQQAIQNLQKPGEKMPTHNPMGLKNSAASAWLEPIAGSSNVKATGYDENRLYVEFLSGAIYIYFCAREADAQRFHEGMQGGSSAGGYLNNNIKKAGIAYQRIK